MMTGKVQNTAAIDFNPQFRHALGLMENTKWLIKKAGKGLI
ncbi:MAG: hypothetical protein AB1401_00135 [Thermodesulfobacteriota bacterium]